MLKEVISVKQSDYPDKIYGKFIWDIKNKKWIVNPNYSTYMKTEMNFDELMNVDKSLYLIDGDPKGKNDIQKNSKIKMPQYKKWDFDIPIIIPSLKRYVKAKRITMMIDSCLVDLFRYYNATNVNVLGQEYTTEDKDYLMAKYPTVNFVWYDKRSGIINTFNKVKKLGVSLGNAYIHYDDDVKMTQTFSDNPTLLAMEHTYNINTKRIGIVTTPSISIHHFKKKTKEYLNLHSNPAQCVLINTESAKDCTYDSRFENFRSDTDFTMQMADKKKIPVILNRYFSFMHTVPLAKIDMKDGKRKFETLDNVNNSSGSIGGDRRMSIRIREYDQFSAKWPLVSTHKNYKQQLLKRSIVGLSNYSSHELVEIEKEFDFGYVNNFHLEYYQHITPELGRRVNIIF